EAEVDAEAEDDQDGQADLERVGARAVLAQHALGVGLSAAEAGHQRVVLLVTSVLVPWLPGTLPMRWPDGKPARCSLPASHSRGWPGAAVFGYGLERR